MESRSRTGAAYAVLAYGSWGLMPAYWKGLVAIPPLELLMHRILGTVVFAALLLSVAGRWGEVAAALRRRRHLAGLVASSVLIGTNWGIFIWAVAHEQVVATSLGYYLTPLANVALGTLVLGERLRPLQLAAVGLAALGVASLAFSLGTLPWISLALAITFALYGLLRKTVAVGSIAGLAVETAILAPVAAVGLALREASGEGAFARGLESGTAALLLCAGVVTGLPLIWFASAAKRLRLATLGFFQYLAPSLALALAVLAFGEPFTRAHAVAFGCIWVALALYSLEAARSLRALERAAAPPALAPAPASAGEP